MPCAYAHYRLGQTVFRGLPVELREELRPFKELYDAGLHGPDILFYHSPLIPDRVTRLGHAIHGMSGMEVFSGCHAVLELHPGPMYRAYVYGYLCHFALDCMCHGYVNDYERAHGVTHNEIEMELDRALETADGLDPLRYETGRHIVASRRNSAVIAAFYPDLTVRDIQRSLKSMPVCLRTLLAPDMTVRRAILAALRASGKYREMSGLLMSLEPGPACAESTRRLIELYKLAVPLAKTLILDFDRTFSGRQAPDRHLELTFLSERAKDR